LRPSGKHRKFWGEEEAGIYNDLAEFAHFIVEAYDHNDRASTTAAFALIEQLLFEGDQEVREAAAIGFLEDVQNIASRRSFGSAVFVQWLGPQSHKEWGEIEEKWRGKRSLDERCAGGTSGTKEKEMTRKTIEPIW
jgi:hypothetical protein